MNDGIAIFAQNLGMAYSSKVQALAEVSFSIPTGSIVGYLGPNGAGKTTTVNILSTAIRPTNGSASILGFDVVKQRDKVRQLIGLAAQDVALEWVLTVYDNLDIFGRIFGIRQPQRRHKINELLDKLGISHRAKAKALTLSGGEARRVQLAYALLRKPPVLFVDEPTLGLDPVGKQAVWQYLRDLSAEGTTIFMASNEMSEVEAICDSVIFIHQGRLIDQGTPAMFIDRYGGGEVIEIFQQEGSCPDSVTKFLAQDAEIQILSYEPLTILAPNKDKLLAQCVPYLLSNGIQIEDIRIHVPNLNDVFFYLTQGTRPWKRSRP